MQNRGKEKFLLGRCTFKKKSFYFKNKIIKMELVCLIKIIWIMKCVKFL